MFDCVLVECPYCFEIFLPFLRDILCTFVCIFCIYSLRTYAGYGKGILYSFATFFHSSFVVLLSTQLFILGFVS